MAVPLLIWAKLKIIPPSAPAKRSVFKFVGWSTPIEDSKEPELKV